MLSALEALSGCRETLLHGPATCWRWLPRLRRLHRVEPHYSNAVRSARSRQIRLGILAISNHYEKNGTRMSVALAPCALYVRR